MSGFDAEKAAGQLKPFQGAGVGYNSHWGGLVGTGLG